MCENLAFQMVTLEFFMFSYYGNHTRLLFPCGFGIAFIMSRKVHPPTPPFLYGSSTNVDKNMYKQRKVYVHFKRSIAMQSKKLSATSGAKWCRRSVLTPKIACQLTRLFGKVLAKQLRYELNWSIWRTRRKSANVTRLASDQKNCWASC